jgi:NTP pyrophosphatase (non-canonical NTP hydrolase)
MTTKDFDDFERSVSRTMPSIYSPEELEKLIFNFTLGLCGETGEFADEIKKQYFHGHQKNKERLLLELGDLLWYLTALSMMLGSGLEEVTELNKKKLEQRYKEKFTQDESRHRAEYEKQNLEPEKVLEDDPRFGEFVKAISRKRREDLDPKDIYIREMIIKKDKGEFIPKSELNKIKNEVHRQKVADSKFLDKSRKTESKGVVALLEITQKGVWEAYDKLIDYVEKDNK